MRVGERSEAGFTRRSLLGAGATLAVAAALAKPRPARAADYKFCAALGWTAYDSGRHMVNGYKDAVAKLGGTLTIADAGYDVKKQADQIGSFVASKPDAIFITPADPAGISPAVRSAVDAGIPVFLVTATCRMRLSPRLPCRTTSGSASRPRISSASA